jgi:hypothetical protein
MMKTLTTIALLVVSLFCAAPARAEIAPEKRAEIEKMLRLSGMERLMDQMKNQMIENFRSSAPEVPAEFWEKLGKAMDVHAMVEELMPIYDKYYSLDDLKAVNAFYASPTGQKVLATMPQLMKEAMEVGQRWGESMGAKALAEIKAERESKAKAQ